ncbi:MAG TPA: hypothetical protein VF581_12325 [Flavobacterium sp.]
MKDFNLENSNKIPSGLKVPEGYFDTLSERVMQNLPQTKVIPLYRRPASWITAAAAVLVLALLMPFFNSTAAASGLDNATIENYLAHQSGLTQYDYLTVLESEDIQSLEVEIPVEDEIIEDVLSSNSNFENLILE